MAEVQAPNEGFNGEWGGVVFVDGVGHTTNPGKLAWFRRKGCEITSEPLVDSKRAVAAIEGTGPDASPVIPATPSEDAAVSIVMTTEERRGEYGYGVGTLSNQGASPSGAPVIDEGLQQLSHGQRQELRKMLDAIDESEDIQVPNTPPADENPDPTTVTPPPAPAPGTDPSTTRTTPPKTTRTRTRSTAKSTAKKTTRRGGTR